MALRGPLNEPYRQLLRAKARPFFQPSLLRWGIGKEHGLPQSGQPVARPAVARPGQIRSRGWVAPGLPARPSLSSQEESVFRKDSKTTRLRWRCVAR